MAVNQPICGHDPNILNSSSQDLHVRWTEIVMVETLGMFRVHFRTVRRPTSSTSVAQSKSAACRGSEKCIFDILKRMTTQVRVGSQRKRPI